MLSHPWLRRHGAVASFGETTLSTAASFYLGYFCPSPVLTLGKTAGKEEFLMPAESQKEWQTHNQKCRATD